MKNGKVGRLRSIDILTEAAKELKRQGRMSIWKGEMIIQVPMMRIEEDGRIVKLNRLASVWQGWKRR